MFVLQPVAIQFINFFLSFFLSFPFFSLASVETSDNHAQGETRVECTPDENGHGKYRGVGDEEKEEIDP